MAGSTTISTTTNPTLGSIAGKQFHVKTLDMNLYAVYLYIEAMACASRGAPFLNGRPTRDTGNRPQGRQPPHRADGGRTMNAVLIVATCGICGIGVLAGLYLCWSPGGSATAGAAASITFGALAFATARLASEIRGWRPRHFPDAAVPAPRTPVQITRNGARHPPHAANRAAVLRPRSERRGARAERGSRGAAIRRRPASHGSAR